MRIEEWMLAWQQYHRSSDNRPYYYNYITTQTTYTHPLNLCPLFHLYNSCKSINCPLIHIDTIQNAQIIHPVLAPVVENIPPQRPSKIQKSSSTVFKTLNPSLQSEIGFSRSRKLQICIIKSIDVSTDRLVGDLEAIFLESGFTVYDPVTLAGDLSFEIFTFSILSNLNAITKELNKKDYWLSGFIKIVIIIAPTNHLTKTIKVNSNENIDCVKFIQILKTQENINLILLSNPIDSQNQITQFLKQKDLTATTRGASLPRWITLVANEKSIQTAVMFNLNDDKIKSEIIISIFTSLREYYTHDFSTKRYHDYLLKDAFKYCFSQYTMDIVKDVYILDKNFEDSDLCCFYHNSVNKHDVCADHPDSWVCRIDDDCCFCFPRIVCAGNTFLDVTQVPFIADLQRHKFLMSTSKE